MLGSEDHMDPTTLVAVWAYVLSTNVSNVCNINGNCSGIGCCQTSIPKGLKGFNVNIGSFDNHMNVRSFNPCGFAFLAEENHFGFGGARDLSGASKLSLDSHVHILVDWVIGRGKRSCSQATECEANSFCMDDEDLGGYRCSCNKGYQGNPYLHNGSQALVGDMLTLAGIIGIFFSIKKRKLMKLREKFFEQNGGVLLKQKLNSQDAAYTVTVYSTDQLRKATDNYSNERIAGRGGFGVVYKGVLSDKRVIAIKMFQWVRPKRNNLSMRYW
ncbi:unnamed protein product [Lactuca virosa]|uniref:EGF-like domain-containing protein n=1 Tax=Lactuca virosa TaxID=75947 RepID=A0AAU9MQK5_9ASTR|nr:unnamed protein product [Lactuca virosa]